MLPEKLLHPWVQDRSLETQLRVDYGTPIPSLLVSSPTY